MHVHDHFKPLSVAEIKTCYQNKSIPVATAMLHVTGDFNLSTLIRKSNFFGYEIVFYVGGKKQYDSNGTVDTHNLKSDCKIDIDVQFLKTEEQFVALIRDRNYKIILIIYNKKIIVDHPSNNFFDFVDQVDVDKMGPVVFVFSDEMQDFSDYILYNSDYILYIPDHETVRNFNIGTASGIVLGYYARLYFLGVRTDRHAWRSKPLSL